MAGRGRGYQSYNYAYNYGHDSTSSYNFGSDSWMTSYPTSSSDGAKLLGPGRDSSGTYNRMDRGRFGFSLPERSFGNWRSQQSTMLPQSGWRGEARGGFRDNFRSTPAIRGLDRPMPLLNKGSFADSSGFQSLRAFTGNSYFGGGFKHKSKKNRRGGKKGTGERGPPEKKPKASAEDDGAKSKSEESESEADGDQEGAGTGTKTEADEKQEEAESAEAAAGKGAKDQKPTPSKKHQEVHGKRLRDRMVERIQFVCSLCKFRTFYSEEMSSHLESEFHKEHFRFVAGKIPKQSADFLQEYIMFKAKKTEERREAIEDLNTTIHQIYRDQDLTHDMGMEHFVKKVEVAHCAACDVVIPMNFAALQRHQRSLPHNQNRRNMMENSKKTALAAVRSILNNKQISQKLERFIKGQNPFTDDPDEGAGSGGAAIETTSEEQETLAAEDHTSEQPNPEEFDASANSANVEMETESSGQYFEESLNDDYGEDEKCSPEDEEHLNEGGDEENPLYT